MSFSKERFVQEEKMKQIEHRERDSTLADHPHVLLLQ